MKLSRLPALGALAVLAACNQAGDGASAGADAESKPVATVNGTSIDRELFDVYVRGISGEDPAELTDEQREQALDNLVRARVVAEEATRAGLDKETETAAILELSRLNILQQAESKRFLDGKTPTEEELRAEYETQIAALPKQEYRARHILVPSEEAAKDIIAKLNKGQKFETLAERESIDSSKSNGGDLGWFTPDRMVPPFAQAVTGLEKGKVTQAPVQTQYGWHVIRLDDTRDVAAPPFEAVKDRLVQVVQAKKFKAHTDELMTAAKIEK